MPFILEVLLKSIFHLDKNFDFRIEKKTNYSYNYTWTNNREQQKSAAREKENRSPNFSVGK